MVICVAGGIDAHQGITKAGTHHTRGCSASQHFFFQVAALIGLWTPPGVECKKKVFTASEDRLDRKEFSVQSTKNLFPRPGCLRKSLMPAVGRPAVWTPSGATNGGAPGWPRPIRSGSCIGSSVTSSPRDVCDGQLVELVTPVADRRSAPPRPWTAATRHSASG